MIKRGWFKEFYQRLTSRFDKYYRVTSFYNPKPDYFLKGGFFGKISRIPKHGHSRLEKATEKEVCEGLEEVKEIEKCSEERESRI